MFWPAKTIFYIFFQRLLPEKAFFQSSWNLFLNESFIPPIGEEFFSIMEKKLLLYLKAFFY